MSAARATVVLVLINYADVEADRGAGLKNMAKVLIALFGSPEAGRGAASWTLASKYRPDFKMIDIIMVI